MVWGEGPPSGRERAIETLIDMEPQGAFYRAARVLDEVVPQALANRPNLITKSALVEQAFALAEHEIDTIEKHDVAFGADLRIGGATSGSTHEESKLNSTAGEVASTAKERILRHHAKLSTVGVRLQAQQDISYTSVNTPSPNLVAALRRIYGSSIDDSPAFVLRSLLKAVMNHKAFARPLASASTDNEDHQAIIEEAADTKKSTDLTTAPIPQIESIISNVCRMSSDQDHNPSSVMLQGLLIASLSLLTQMPSTVNLEGESASDISDDNNSNKTSSKGTETRPKAVTEDPIVYPFLQVGALLSLLRVEPTDGKVSPSEFSLDDDLLSYFGKAAMVYEERIEIQKSRLLVRMQDNKDQSTTSNPVELPTDVLAEPTAIPDTDGPVMPLPLTPTEGGGNDTFFRDQAEELELAEATISTARALEQIISSATGDETSSDAEEEEADLSSESESVNSEDNDSETITGYEDGVTEEQELHTSPAVEANEEESASDSSSADDVAMMSEDHAITDTVQEDEDVLREALALSLAEQANTNSELDTDVSSVQVRTEEHEGQRGQECVNSVGVEAHDVVSKKEVSETSDDSDLPQLPSAPAVHSYSSILGQRQGPGSDDAELNLEGSMSQYLDPSSLVHFGSLPAPCVLLHLMKYIGRSFDRKAVVQSKKDRSNDSPGENAPSSFSRGMGCSLFIPEQPMLRSSLSKDAKESSDVEDVAVTLQLLVAYFIQIVEKRNDAIEHFVKAASREQTAMQADPKDKHGLTNDEEDDPAIALAMNNAELESGETSDSLEAKGMRRKAAAAAHDAASLMTLLKRRTESWKQCVALYSQCALYAMKSLRSFLQSIVREWLLGTKSSKPVLSVFECKDFLPSSVGMKLTKALSSLKSTSILNFYSKSLSGVTELEFDDIFKGITLYKEGIMTWVECVPLLYPTPSDQLDMLRSMISECSVQVGTKSFPNIRSLEFLSSLPSLDVETHVYHLQLLCRRLRVSDALESFVSKPIGYSHDEQSKMTDIDSTGDSTSNSPFPASTIVSLLGASLRKVVGGRRDLQRLYLAICHRLHQRVLLWDALFECAESDSEELMTSGAAPTVSPGDSIRVSANPTNSLQFDSTKCSDSIAILSGSETSSAVNGSSVHQRASKVWGTVLSTHHYSPKTGVHRWAVRLDKCERGHVFVGVATSQASMRTYVGGDKYGWGMIGTQALWHDRRKIRGDYGATFRTGSTIIVTLDTDAGTLSFSSWKDSNSTTSFSLDPMIQNQSGQRRHFHVGGTIEDWGIAFEGLPLDSRLYPAVGLYQRDDRVTLLTVESGGAAGGRESTVGFSGGQCYYPSLDSSMEKWQQDRMHKIRRYNDVLSWDGVQYVTETLRHILRTLQDKEDEFLLTSLLPSLGSALCLVPSSIPILSERIALYILPQLSKFIKALGRIRGEREVVHKLFDCGLKPGKWIIRATGSSGTSSDYEEYVVDLNESRDDSGAAIGFEGTGVGTTGKSKNGLVAIFGTVRGSSLHFVEEWSDGSDDGFASSSLDETSSCVVAARLCLDGTKFEGTYRNVQFGSTGQIAGVLHDESSSISKLRLSDSPAASKQNAEISCAIVTGEALLCLAHSHMATVVGGDAAGDQACASDSENTKRSDTSDSIFQECLSRPLLAMSSLSSADSSLIVQVDTLKQLYSLPSHVDGHREGEHLLLLDYISIKEAVTSMEGLRAKSPLTHEIWEKVAAIDATFSKNPSLCGSLSKLCPAEYEYSRRMITCAFVRHCDLYQSLDQGSLSELKSVWSASLKVIEDGLRKAMREKRKSGTIRQACSERCAMFDKISSFLLSLQPGASPMKLEEVAAEFSWFFSVITETTQLNRLRSEMEAASRRALLRLVALQEVFGLLASSAETLDSSNRLESIIVGLPRLLGRAQSDSSFRLRKPTELQKGNQCFQGVGGHVSSGYVGASPAIQLAIRTVVHKVFEILGTVAENSFTMKGILASQDRALLIDSLILTVLGVFATSMRHEDTAEVIMGSGIMQTLPKVLATHRDGISGSLEKPKESPVSVVAELQRICKLEVSRAVLRVSVAAAHALIYQSVYPVVTNGEVGTETETAARCLNLLLGELTYTFPLVESSALAAADNAFVKRGASDWEKWCETNALNESRSRASTKKTVRHQVGSSGLQYLQERGSAHIFGNPLSSPKPSRQKGGSSSSEGSVFDNLAKFQGSFTAQFLSHWLHVLCAVLKSEMSLPLITKDPKWILLLLSAVGLSAKKNQDGSFLEVKLKPRKEGLLPGRYRARVLRLLLPLLESIEACELIVSGLFNLAGVSSPFVHRNLDEDEFLVSRESVSLLRQLHSPSRPSWREKINRVAATILSSNPTNERSSISYLRIGVMSFISGSLEVVGRGSYVLLKPAAAVPLSANQQTSQSSKGHSTGNAGGSGAGIGATPHHIVGNGTEGVVAGLCRNDASAGLVSSIDMKNGICEVILLSRDQSGGDSPESSLRAKATLQGAKGTSSQRHTLTVRALRTPLSDVVSAQEVPLYIDDSSSFDDFVRALVEHSLDSLRKGEEIAESSFAGPSSTDNSCSKGVPNHLYNMSSSLLILRSLIVVLSDERVLTSFLRMPSSSQQLAQVLRLAWPVSEGSQRMSQNLQAAQKKFISALPVHEARYSHLMSILLELHSRSISCERIGDDQWKTRLSELRSRQSDDSQTKENHESDGYRTPPVLSGTGSDTPPIPSGASAVASQGGIDSVSRNVDTSAHRGVSQSTIGSNSEEEEDSEAAATAAAHLREAAIAQMAELGLPRSWSELALRRTGGTNIEAAVHFCLERGGDMERLLAEERERERLRQRQSSGGGSRRRGFRSDSSSSNHFLRQLLEMGFPSRWCAEALAATGNNVDEALTWLLTNGERLSEEDEAMEEDGDADEVEEDEDDSIEEDDDDEGNLSSVAGGDSDVDPSQGAEWNDSRALEGSQTQSETQVETILGWSGSLVPLRFISGRSIIDPKTLAISGLPTGGFSSVGTKGILLTSGKWYYEAILETAGCLQIGWADGSFAGHCHADRGDGCGDGPSSWAYDGWRRYRWHSTATEWGCRWKEGDVVGSLVDLDKRTVSFTLNGRAEEIGMGVAFQGEGFRPCGGVYACVSFNRREKLRLILGGTGTETFKFQPPPGYRGVGEAVLDAVKERDFLVSKEEVLESPSTREEAKPFLCDFSDGEHGHELMAWAHRYYGSDASVHLGSGRPKQSGGNQKSSSSSSSDMVTTLCVDRRLEKAWSGSTLALPDDGCDGIATVKKSISKGLDIACEEAALQLSSEAAAILMLLARKLVMHVVITKGEGFDLQCFDVTPDVSVTTAVQFWKVVEACTSLRSAGWVGEAGAMAIAAEALGLGISSNDHSHSRQAVAERSGVTSIGDIDDGMFLPTGGISQLLSSVLFGRALSNTRETGNSLAASAEAAIGSDGGGGVLVFLQQGLQGAVSRSEALQRVLIAAIRKSVRLLAVVEYEGDDLDTDMSENREDDNDSERNSSPLERRSSGSKDDDSDDREGDTLPDARLASFLTGLMISAPIKAKIGSSAFRVVLEELFQAWSIGLLSASLPWRMVCAFTAAGMLNLCPQALGKALESFPTLASFYGRLKSTVARRVWAERAAVPVCSRYSQSMIELLASVNRAISVSTLPSDFAKFWNDIRVDAATPLPLSELPLSSNANTGSWESNEGWISSDDGWEVWTGSVEYKAVDWKTPSRSAVRTLMDGGEGPPMLREGCTVMRGLDWDDDNLEAKRGNEDGQNIYEMEKANREKEKRRLEGISTENAEGGDPPHDVDGAVTTPSVESEGTEPAEEKTINSSAGKRGIEGDEKVPSRTDSATKAKKKKFLSPKLPIGIVLSVEAWNGVPGLARRVRWNLTGAEGLYRFGGDGGRYDIAHVETNEKGTRVKKRHPLPESAEQCAARHGFGAPKRYSVMLRMRSRGLKTEVNGQHMMIHEGIMEWPDFGAGVRVSCEKHSSGSIKVTEHMLLYGAKDSGWEARFGQPSFVAGSEFLLKEKRGLAGESKVELDIKSSYLSFYEELIGNSSFDVSAVRNRANGENVQVHSQMHLLRGTRSTSHSSSIIPASIEAPLPPSLHFDRDYHASSLSLSRDGRTVSCVASDGRGTAFASMGFTKGVHYWEVKIEQADIGSVFIGVAEKPNGSGSGSSFGYDSPPKLNNWHGWGYVNFRATYTSTVERVYGAHCHAGDTVGVLLDCDAGRVSFFFDGLKYGEHILNDLGCAFENLSPFGFNVDGCGSGGAGQGAPSGIEGGRGGRYPAQGAVRPRALWPVVGLKNQGDRVTLSPKWTTSYGVDGVTAVKNILAVDELLALYANHEFATNQFPEWFVKEAFSEYQRWYSEAWRRVTTRGSGPYRFASFGMDLDLDASPVACAAASAGLGLRRALVAGDRVRLLRSAGRILELAEEAVVLGAYQGRLFYQIVSQKSEGGSLTEGGGRAWCWDESEVVDGLPFVEKGLAEDIELPLLDRFKLTASGGLQVVYEGGAVVRSDLEIFDGSLNLGTIPVNTVIPKADVLERRVNSCGLVRYRVKYEATGEGWISARIRGGKEESIVEPVNATVADPDEIPESSFATALDSALSWYEHFKETRPTLEYDKIRTNFEITDFDSFKRMLENGAVSGLSMLEWDSLLASVAGVIGNHSEGGDAVDCRFKDAVSAIQYCIGSTAEIGIEPSKPAVREAAATILSSVGTQIPPITAVMARIAMIRAFNRRARWALPWMSVRPCQEGSAIMGGLSGHGASTNRSGRNRLVESLALWVQVPSIASNIRACRGLFFTSVKKGLLLSVTEATATPTPLSHDEYELPREIRTVRINRLKAARARAGDDIGSKRKYSVFSQLQNETKGWGGAALRRGYVAKGHGGQRRAFRVKLIGEGVNDYSGPYREAFTDAMSEVIHVSKGGNGALGVLDPTPNNTAEIGDQRDLFMFSLNGRNVFKVDKFLSEDVTREERRIKETFMSLTASRDEASREVEEALVFLGRLTGTGFRHGIPVDLPLPLHSVWNNIVEQSSSEGEQLHELDILAHRQMKEDGKSSPLLRWQQRMLNSFVEGLSNVLPVEILTIFSGEELRDILCGNPDVDVDLLREVVEYEGYEEDQPVIQYFWETLREMSNSERKVFLQFVWARNRLPLKATDFEHPFKIQKDHTKSGERADMALPSATTCFFSLALPEYSSKEILREKLLFAINNVTTMETDFQTNSAEIAEGYRAF